MVMDMRNFAVLLGAEVCVTCDLCVCVCVCVCVEVGGGRGGSTVSCNRRGDLWWFDWWGEASSQAEREW